MTGETPITVSVVIPTHDRPKLLAEALASVWRQSVPPHEVIVVNNGESSIGPALAADERTRVLTIMPHAGAAQARNFGAIAATGTHVAFLDDDDQWEVEYLEKVGRRLVKHDPDYLIARLDRLEGGVVKPYRAVHDVTTLLSAVWITNPGVGGPNSVVKRETFLRLGGYDPQLVTSEDRSLVAEFLLADCRVVAAPEIVAIARGHSGDRLTGAASMAEGKRRFLGKYANHMTRGQRWRNRAVISLMRWRSSRNPWHLLELALYLPGSELLRLRERRRDT